MMKVQMPIKYFPPRKINLTGVIIMFNWYKKKRIEKYSKEADLYATSCYISDDTAKKSNEEGNPGVSDIFGEVRYSHRGDSYDMSTVNIAMSSLYQNFNVKNAINLLDKSSKKTFVDTLIDFINRKGLRDSDVYRAAQLDRRLFSKIMSDKEYKPAKDTAFALAFGLKLTISEAQDLLERAGYTFSHSNKRDIIIEYFFREKIYNLNDINEVLYMLGQKTIGR